MHGQEIADPSADARVHLGPLALSPSLQIPTIGVDTNVFNSVDNPQRDFTITMEPQTDAWLHFGPGLLSARIGLGLVYFQKFTAERAINTDDSFRLDLPLNRLRPYVIESYSNARRRPTEEIDARARYRTDATTVGLDLAVFGKTSVGVYARRDRTRFDQDELFFNVDLAQNLNRTGTAAGLRLSHDLTPLTTVVLTGETAQDRFEFSPDRSARSLSGTVGLVLKPEALISGNASIGYEAFEMPDADVTSYHGLTATAGVGYVLLGMTKFDAQVTRQVQYSFDSSTPYYVLSGVSGSITQRILGPVSLVVDGGNQRLVYRTRAGAPDVLGRTDTVQRYGGGLSYRLGPTLDLGFLVNQERRRSTAELREFSGLRFGLSLSYGHQ